MKKNKRPSGDDAAATTSLGDLLRARGLTATAPAHDAPEAAPEAPEPGGDVRLSGKVVLERTRKGRGGRTVTLVRRTGLDPAGLDALARALRKELGCGASVETDAVVLQGDQVDRVRPILLARGAGKVVGA